MRSEAGSDGREQVDPGGFGDGWRERAAVVVDPSLRPVLLPRELMLEIFQHARECYPEECCGLLTGVEGSGEPSRFVRCTNVQSRRRSMGESELDARHGFWIDELELLRTLRETEERGEALQVVYHSHIDTPAYLSHTDLQGAVGHNGAPLWPGVAHLVVSVQDGGVHEAALFEWDSEAGRFLGRAVQETG